MKLSNWDLRGSVGGFNLPKSVKRAMEWPNHEMIFVWLATDLSDAESKVDFQLIIRDRMT